MTKKKFKNKARESSKRRGNGKKGRKEAENLVAQAKMYCTEAASHVKGGNYTRALQCYNLVSLSLNSMLKINYIQNQLFKSYCCVV